MKLTKGQLRRIINEEAERLNELFDGSSMGSHLKQGISKLWEADNMFKAALAEAPDNETHKAIEAIHKACENLAFAVDGKMQKLVK